MKKLILSLTLLQVCFLFAQEFPIATGSYSQTYPSSVFANDLYYTSFLDKSSGSYNYGFHGKFVGLDGTVLPQDIEIVSPISYLSFMHEIIYGQESYFFVWSRGVSLYDRDAYGLLVDDDGYPHGNIFPVSIGNSESASFVEAAFDGENFLVIWQEGLPNSGSVIRAQFVNQEGQLVGNNFSIRPEGIGSQVDQIYPDVEFNGEHYFVVWDDVRNGNRDIYGQFVSVTGALIGEDVAITSNNSDQLLVQLAFGGQHFYAVWADERLSSNDNSIYGQLIDADGNLIGDNLMISPQTNSEGRSWPDVAASDGEFLVTWDQEWLEYDKSQDSRNLIDKQKYEAAGVELPRPTVWYDVYARKISFQGAYASDEMAICTADYHQQDCDVISDGADFLVSWSDSRNGNQYYNIYGYIVEGSEIPALPELIPDEIDFVNMGQILEGEEFSVVNPNSFPVSIDSIYFITSDDRLWYLTEPVNFPLTVDADSLVSIHFTMSLPAGNMNPEMFETDTAIVETMDAELDLLLHIDEALLDSIYTPEMAFTLDSLYFQTVDQAIGGLTFGMLNNHYAGFTVSGTDVTGSYALWNVTPDEEIPYTIGFMDTLNFHVVSVLPVLPDYISDGIGIDTLWIDSWGSWSQAIPIFYETAVIDSIWTSASDIHDEKQIMVFPNPADEFISVRIPKPAEILRVGIMNANGKLVKSIVAGTGKPLLYIQVSELSGGIYLLRVVTSDKSYNHKLVIHKRI